jgi:hypothetical protein
MKQSLFNAADAASFNATLVPAPLSDGHTVEGFTGLMLHETRNPVGDRIVSVSVVASDGSVVASDGSVVGVLLDERRFDTFCAQLAPFVERARDRIDAEASWAGMTPQ